jgi:hypothetical protein
MHDGRRTQIDHVLASAALYPRLEEARFLNAELREHAPVRPRPSDPAGSRGGGAAGVSEPPTVDSDHAPLVTRFG